ncbi:hypothetical protein PVK06_012400 [Gossypium arboreum]|uniref:DUF7745 domain-containing protein n=1 Tax=Gossypium arboreum TaxID=29729 RepID=A0ABR0QB92_GOSAR|nr:hypothetical protein PVK06_012400 [Gossypium arboreum]
MVQLWNPGYSCLTFGEVDVVLTLEEYTTLLRCLRIQDVTKKVNVLALSIYALVIFPKAIGHIDEAVADLFDRISKQNTPVLVILAETFRSLKYMPESQ